MKNMKLVKLVITLMVLVTMVFAISGVYAEDGNMPQIQINLNQTEETTNNVENTVNETPVVIAPTNTETGSEKLPQTGDAGDYVIYALIAVGVVTAVYAFKKVKNYNI